MRYEGDLNVDLNEITMNMVPYPKQHFLQQNYNDLALVQKLIAQITSLAIAYE